MQCGVACLAMICRHYGVKYPMDELSSLCHPTHEGVSMLAIKECAKKIGFETLCAETSINQLKDALCPCILYWNQNHFVVLYRVSRDKKKFYIADPNTGKHALTQSELEEKWVSHCDKDSDLGLVMFLEPRETFGISKSSKSSKSISFKFLLKYILRYRKYFTQILCGLLLGCILQLLMPFLTQWIVDIGIKHEDIRFIWLVLLGELMIIIGRTVTDFIRRRLLLHISMRINISLISDFFIKLLKLPMSFFDTKIL